MGEAAVARHPPNRLLKGATRQSSAVTFLQFLLIFMVAPTALLIAAHGVHGAERMLATAGAVAIVVVIVLAPLDHLLMAKGIWDYGADKVQATAWDVPVEKYGLRALQVVFVVALTAIVLRRWPWRG